MTGTCTRECSEFGHSDTCWMPGQSSPSRRTKSSALKLSTFVPYQDRGGQEPAGAGSPSPPEDRNTKTAPVRLLPSYSAFSHSSHDSCKDSATLEEIPLTQTSDFPPTATPASAQTAAKREIYLVIVEPAVERLPLLALCKMTTRFVLGEGWLSAQSLPV